MFTKIIWLLLFGLLAFIVVASVTEPNILLENKFISTFISHEVINSLIVMVTVTLAVSLSLIDKVSGIEHRLTASQKYSEDEKHSIGSSLRSAKSKIKHSAILMACYLIISTVFLILSESIVATDLRVKSFLIGFITFLFFHSIILMVEMYVVLYNWDLREEDIVQ